ncbi:MAG: hypothetical protein ACE5EC_04580 [Phycisphaerae bacterium]
MSSSPVTFRNLPSIVAMFVLLGAIMGGDSWAQPQPDDPKTEKKATADSTTPPAPKPTADGAKPEAKGVNPEEAKKAGADTKSKKASAESDPKPRRAPSYSEILKELQKETRGPGRIIVPRRHPDQAGVRRTSIDPGPNNAIQPVERKLLPDGSRIVDRTGRLTRAGNLFTFSFESRSKGAPDMPIRLLPNRLLEDMEIFSDGGQRPIVFVISGEITEYRGVNYLLLQKLLVRPDLGNLK